MCDYCEPVGTIDRMDYPVFEDFNEVYPVEVCEVMTYSSRAEVFLARHAVDWYLVLVDDMVIGTGDTLYVSACPVCGREL